VSGPWEARPAQRFGLGEYQAAAKGNGAVAQKDRLGEFPVFGEMGFIQETARIVSPGWNLGRRRV